MPTSNSRFGLRIAVITAVALLFAQLGAMTHAYSHPAGAVQTSVHQPGSSGHDFCGDCLNFAPLLAAAGTPDALPEIQPQGTTNAVHHERRSQIDLLPTPSFRSRAPPLTPMR